MSWFDEDPELLRAALEIIESWDGPSSVNGVPVASSPSTEETDSANDEDGSEDTHTPAQPSPPPTTVSTTSTAKKGGAPRELKPSTVSSTRHKRREEIIYLRDKVKDMETQLLTLQKQHTAGGDDSAAPVMNGVETALAVMWQDIAGRQQRLRHKAELEQAKLRELLETQMKVARGLIKLMQKARRIEDDESFPAPKRAKLPIDVSVDVSEETQRSHIEELYSRIEESFTFSKFHDGTLKFIDVEVLDRAEDEVVIEFRDAWALPFEVGEVMDAMWTYMFKKTGQGECRDANSKVVKISDDTFTTHFTASSTVGALKGSFDGKAIYKKFFASAERGPAIVSSMSAEPHSEKGDHLDGIRMREDAWLRVVPAHSLTGQSDGRTLSVVQSDRHFRLSFDAAVAPASRRNAGVLTDFLLDQLMQEIKFKHETVETLLLQMRSQ